MTWRSRVLRAARRICRRRDSFGLTLGSYLDDQRPPRKGYLLPWSGQQPPWRLRARREYLRVLRALRTGGAQSFVPGATRTFDGRVFVVAGDGEIVDARPEAWTSRSSMPPPSHP